MTDVWDAEYNCREKKKAGMQDQDQPHPPPPHPSDSEPHGKNKMQL